MTQNDTKRHMFRGVTALSIEQENAINLLLTGASDQSVTSRLKLSRSSLHRWRHYHPLFIAELNRRREVGRKGSLDFVRSLLPKALDTVRDQIVNGDAQLSLAFLHKAGLFGTRETGPLIHTATGPTDALAVVDDEVRRRRADGRLPMPAVPHSPSVADSNGSANGSTNGAAGQTESVVEPPITEAERDLVLADLLAEASSDAPPDLPFDAPASLVDAVAAGHLPTVNPVGDPAGAGVVNTRTLASLG